MKKLISLAAALLFAAAGLIAQQPQPLPVDPAVRMGVLPNGMTYYIRHNEQPKGQCDFHIAQAVGSILEEDNQNGLAHFLEHMAFNGSTHFPGKNLINYFESIGVTFGGGINAYTAHDETVYRLSNVPTTREGIIDTALLVLHDWSSSLLLQDEEIDSERGVIREEWRTVSNANRRMYFGGLEAKYPDSKYARRTTIGDTAVINNFKYQELRDYYHRWYGPDLQAVVVVGDIDVDRMEKKIIDLFSPIPERANRGVRPVYPISDNEQPIIGRYTDKEAQYSRFDIEFKHPALPREIRLTDQGYTIAVVNNLISAMVNNRMQELAMNPDASFIQSVGYYANILGVTDGFQFIIVPKDGKEKEAFRDQLLQIEKIKRYGFTVSEFERAKTELLSAIEKQYNERDNRKNTDLAENEYIRHYLDGQPIPGIEWEYNTLKMLFPQLPVDIANQLAQNYITDHNVVMAYIGKDLPTAPTEAEMLETYKASKTAEIAAPVEEKFDRPLVETTPKAGKIKKETTNTHLGTTEWTLSNGIRVILKPTNFKSDEILMNITSPGGLSHVDVDDLPSAELATAIVSQNGLGTFSYIDMQKALTGKQAHVGATINDYRESITGQSTIKDFETMMQLAYLHFTAPRRDDDAYRTLISMLETTLSARDQDPKNTFNDSITLTARAHHPRASILNTDFIRRADQQRALDIYRQRFANPADFTVYLVGNIDPKDPNTRQLICTWLGGLKTNKRRHETLIDNHIRYATGKVNNYFTRPMEINAASNRIMYTGTLPYTLANRVNTNVIGDILQIRYTESIREKEGGTYGVGTISYLENEPISQAVILMQFDTDPEKQPKLMTIIHKEVMDIVANGPREDDLNKVKEDMIKSFERDIETNNFWLNTILHRYYNDNIDYAADYLDAIRAITPATVQATLKQIVDQGNIMEVVMSPAK